jgi:hypothetical protein
VTLDLKELSPPLRRKIIAKRDRFDRAVRRIIREGTDAGVFRRVDPKVTTFAIMGGVNWIPHWFDPSGKADPQAIGVAFADFFVAGLLANGARDAVGRQGPGKIRRMSDARSRTAPPSTNAS